MPIMIKEVEEKIENAKKMIKTQRKGEIDRPVGFG